MSASPPRPHKGRGAGFNPANRFRREQREAFDDGWTAPPAEDEELPPPKTTVSIQRARTIIAHNESPDIPFSQSINPYQGCEHGCIYCYARPTHAYLDLSPGLDFETKLFAKPNAAELLRTELAKPGYKCEHPLTITTKGVLVERDLDLLAPMAAKRLARVYVSIAVLDPELARKLDPRAPAPRRRMQIVKTLSEAGIPVGVSVAPVIPQLTDRDLESILEGAAANGARWAAWIMLRLPREVAPLFRDWLAEHHPLRAEHVMSIVQQIRGGRDNDPNFGSRMRGSGQFSELIARRFAIACKRLGLNGDREPLDTARFRPPQRSAQTGQLELFGG